jgi:hypothetical protein
MTTWEDEFFAFEASARPRFLLEVGKTMVNLSIESVTLIDEEELFVRTRFLRRRYEKEMVMVREIFRWAYDGPPAADTNRGEVLYTQFCDAYVGSDELRDRYVAPIGLFGTVVDSVIWPGGHYWRM